MKKITIAIDGLYKEQETPLDVGLDILKDLESLVDSNIE